MLVVSNISKRFPGEETPVFSNVSFTVNGGECVGLIGKNGSGKSTLLRIVMGELAADGGSIHYTRPDLRIGYLAQGLDAPDSASVQDVLFPHLHTLREAEANVERLAEAISLAANGQMAQLMAAYSAAIERLERLNAVFDERRGRQLLVEVGLQDVSFAAPIGTLSGGQKTRLGLAAVLMNSPQLIVLDEPTNHLDITALAWLERWLQGFDGGVLLVSHDRTFLDNTVNRIVALDEKTHTARVFEGNYSSYVHTVRSELDKQWAEWRDQQVEITRLEVDIRQTMAKAIRRENATHNDQQRRYAKKVAKRAKAKEKRLDRYLESDDRVGKPTQGWHLKLDFDRLPTTGQDVIFLEDLSVGYDPARPLLEHLTLALGAGERIALLGPNGSGKSTLMKTIIGEIPPLGGRVRLGASVRIGYLAQEQENLDPTQNALDTLLAYSAGLGQTDARSFLHHFLFTGDDVLKPVAQLSFGERVRLMLALLVMRGSNLLILDEPINHLDVPSREQFEQALESFQGSVLAVVHDRYFVDKFATTIWELEGHTIVRR